jgi:hypothetical protein
MKGRRHELLNCFIALSFSYEKEGHTDVSQHSLCLFAVDSEQDFLTAFSARGVCVCVYESVAAMQGREKDVYRKLGSLDGRLVCFLVFVKSGCFEVRLIRIRASRPGFVTVSQPASQWH